MFYERIVSCSPTSLQKAFLFDPSYVVVLDDLLPAGLAAAVAGYPIADPYAAPDLHDYVLGASLLLRALGLQFRSQAFLDLTDKNHHVAGVIIMLDDDDPKRIPHPIHRFNRSKGSRAQPNAATG